jgi:SAM-dependent methyltransferase
MRFKKKTIDPITEQRVIKLFIEKLKEKGETDEYIQNQIDYIFPLTGGFIERFDLLQKYLENKHYQSLLVSGSAVGSELFVGIQRGFKEVYGTEVWDLYVNISKLRFKDYKNIHSLLVSGVNIPFKDEMFSAIMSGHIIEHTMAPEEYLVEHFRVLKRGGVFYLEFPDRDHITELHTGTISFERFPLLIRNFMLKILSSNFNLNSVTRSKYKSVLNTLLPIGERDIIKWLTKNNIRFNVLYVQVPHPGFKRMIIKKLD